MPSEQFSLHWDNFHKNMSSGLQTLLQSEALVDVTLAVEGQYIKAHKMILSVCSPYFQKLFEMNPCKHPIVFMKDVSYQALNDIMQFMYFGEVQVSQENLALFIKTAEALQIKGLTGDNNEADQQTKQFTNELEENVIRKTSRVSSAAPATTNSVSTQRKKRPPSPPAKRRRTAVPAPIEIETPADRQEPDVSLVAPTQIVKAEPINVDKEEEELADESCDMTDYPLDDGNEEMDDFPLAQSGTDANLEQPGTSGAEDASQELIFVRSQKGFPHLVYKNYRYRMDKRQRNRMFWRCARLGCKARCVTENFRVVHVYNSEHCHPPDADRNKLSAVQLPLSEIALLPLLSDSDVAIAVE